MSETNGGAASRTSVMQALQSGTVRAQGEAHVVEVPVPVPGPSEVLVRVRVAGVCATDLELTRGYMGFAGTLGHEFVGEVVTEGSALAGRRVVGEINAACGHCADCVAGMGRHCASRSVLGIVARDGCMAEYLCLPERNLLPVPDGVSDEAAVFTEPLAAALEILEQVHIAPAAHVAVLGDGRLGLLVAMALQAAGCAPLLVGRHPHKLAIAEAAGVSTVLAREGEDSAEFLLPRHFDVVVDATGRTTGVAQALELLKPRGTLVLKTTVAENPALDLARVVVDEITIVGSRCGRFAPALAMLERGAIDPTALIQYRYPLREGAAALKRAGECGVLKVLVTMSGPEAA